MPTIRLMNATTGHSTARGSDHLGHPSQTLESSKTESYLLSLLTNDVTPTLRDLERLKPPEHPDLHSKEYTAVYSALLDSICHSFSNDQLRSFTQQYGLSLGSKLRKASYAEAIIEKAWQWPSLRELKHARSGCTEVTYREGGSRLLHFPECPIGETRTMIPGVALIFLPQLYGPPLQRLGYEPSSFDSTSWRTNELLGWPPEVVILNRMREKAHRALAAVCTSSSHPQPDSVKQEEIEDDSAVFAGQARLPSGR
ncbi:hypothetical protein EDB83DRAFT_2321615 [Lactarius deliciosus]|nr:hypothetical protein EDB83DRAFT_2321615 [Lactarius deliciosus]